MYKKSTLVKSVILSLILATYNGGVHATEYNTAIAPETDSYGNSGIRIGNETDGYTYTFKTGDIITVTNKNDGSTFTGVYKENRYENYPITINGNIVLNVNSANTTGAGVAYGIWTEVLDRSLGNITFNDGVTLNVTHIKNDNLKMLGNATGVFHQGQSDINLGNSIINVYAESKNAISDGAGQISAQGIRLYGLTEGSGNGKVTMGDGQINVTVVAGEHAYESTGATGIVIDGRAHGSVELGNVVITATTKSDVTNDSTSGYDVQGLYNVGGSNSLIKGKNVTITAKAETSNYNNGKKAYSYGVYNANNIELESADITSQNVLKADMSGYAYGIYNRGSGNINIIGNTNITSNAEGKGYIMSHGIYNNGSSSSKITLGDGKIIGQSKSTNDVSAAYGVRSTNGVIDIGKSDISAIAITDSGTVYSYGILAENLAKINIAGGSISAVVNELNKANQVEQAAIYAKSNSKVIINKDTANEMDINGDIKVFDYAVCDVTLNTSDSIFTGSAKDNTTLTSDTTGIKILMDNNAKWNMTEDSTITSLEHNGGALINLAYHDKSRAIQEYRNLTVGGSMKGNGGIINMNINADNKNESDRLYIQGTHSGEHYITLNNVGVGTDGALGTVLVSVNDEQGEFKANNSEGTLYWNRYELDRLDQDNGDAVTSGYKTDWYLKEVEQIDEPTTSVDIAMGANALNYHTWRTENDKLMKRMGDLRNNGEDEKGAWFRVRGAEIGRDGSAGFENKYTAYELGYDEITKKTDRFTRYQGAALSYIDGSSSFGRGSGENDGKSIAFYTTEMRNKGHYLDLVFRIADMDSDYSVYDTNGNKITGSPENVGVSLSAEYGRKKVMDENGWYIEPQGQLTLGYFGGDNYETSNGIKVHQGGIPSVVGRVGFNIGRDIDENTNIYLKANLLHEFMGDYEVRMMDSTGISRTESDSFNDTWFEYGIGAAVKTGKNNHLYFDFEKTAGGDFEKDWAWNAGMRWTF